MSAPDDLTTMTSLTVDSIRDSLATRYAEDLIYTFLGKTLVSVNPYKEVTHKYSLEDYTSHIADSPHVYGLVEGAVEEMRRTRNSASILVSGESGAGKTEATKMILRYVGHVTGTPELEDRIMEASPLLEALGNAKTTRNGNSSRFGKFVLCYMDEEMRMTGAFVETYLLEKSRVVFQGAGESNFHIFWQVANGRKFKILGEASPHAEWEPTEQALLTLGTEKDVEMVRKMVEGILWLGEITFEADKEGAKVVDSEAVRYAAANLGLREEEIRSSLVFEQLDTRKGGTILRKRLNVAKAETQRGALMKLLYNSLFEWSVELVNKALKCEKSNLSIGVLDIFGFECMEKNQFEQFLINYANEKLHALFIKTTLEEEQDLYKREGITWDVIKFQDNQEVISSITHQLRSLDDRCHLGNAKTDSGWAERKAFVRLEQQGKKLIIEHYAGNVTYDSTNMIKSNVDSVDIGLWNLCSTSTLDMMVSVFGNATPDNSRKKTIAQKFRNQVEALVSNVSKTKCHFIKCIKPNHLQLPEALDKEMTAVQVSQNGLVEVAKVRKSGYEIHISQKEFQSVYGFLGPWETVVNDLKKGQMSTQWEELLMGKTMVFMKAHTKDRLDIMLRRLEDAAAVLQRSWRRHCRNQHLKRVVSACVAVVKRTEAERERKRKEEEERRRREEEERRRREEEERKRKEAAQLLKEQQEKERAKDSEGEEDSVEAKKEEEEEECEETVIQGIVKEEIVNHLGSDSSGGVCWKRRLLVFDITGCLQLFSGTTKRTAVMGKMPKGSYGVEGLEGDMWCITFSDNSNRVVLGGPQTSSWLQLLQNMAHSPRPPVSPHHRAITLATSGPQSQPPESGNTPFASPKLSRKTRRLSLSSCPPSQFKHVSEFPTAARQLFYDMKLSEEEANRNIGVLSTILMRVVAGGSGKDEQEAEPNLSGVPVLSAKDMKQYKGKELFKGNSSKVYKAKKGDVGMSKFLVCVVFHFTLSSLSLFLAVKMIPLKDGAKEAFICLQVPLCPSLWKPTVMLSDKQDVLLVGPYLEAAPLANMIRHGNLSEAPRAARLLAQLLEAVQALHLANIVHRSINPHNILVDANGQLTLIDYGSARQVGQDGLHGIYGAPFFVAPEMILQRSHHFPSDIYSFGVVAYNLLTGHLPSLAPNEKSSRVKGLMCMYIVGTCTQKSTFALPSSFSPVCQDFVTKCLLTDEEERPTAEELRKHDFLAQQTMTLDLKKALTSAKREKSINKMLN